MLIIKFHPFLELLKSVKTTKKQENKRKKQYNFQEKVYQKMIKSSVILEENKHVKNLQYLLEDVFDDPCIDNLENLIKVLDNKFNPNIIDDLFADFGNSLFLTSLSSCNDKMAMKLLTYPNLIVDYSYDESPAMELLENDNLSANSVCVILQKMIDKGFDVNEGIQCFCESSSLLLYSYSNNLNIAGDDSIDDDDSIEYNQIFYLNYKENNPLIPLEVFLYNDELKMTEDVMEIIEDFCYFIIKEEFYLDENNDDFSQYILIKDAIKCFERFINKFEGNKLKYIIDAMNNDILSDNKLLSLIDETCYLEECIDISSLNLETIKLIKDLDNFDDIASKTNFVNDDVKKYIETLL